MSTRLTLAVLVAMITHGALLLLPLPKETPTAVGALSVSLGRQASRTPSRNPAASSDTIAPKNDRHTVSPVASAPESKANAWEPTPPSNPSPFGNLSRSNELDHPLNVLGELEIEPPEGFPEGASGSAQLSLLVGEDGQTKWLGVDASTLPSEILERVIEKFSSAQFSPPLKGGKPIRALIKMEVNLAPEAPNCEGESGC